MLDSDELLSYTLDLLMMQAKYGYDSDAVRNYEDFSDWEDEDKFLTDDEKEAGWKYP